MKAKEIRELSITEIEKKLRDGRGEYMNLRLSQQTSQIEKTHRFKELRRSIACFYTILREKKLESPTPTVPAPDSKKPTRPKSTKTTANPDSSSKKS